MTEIVRAAIAGICSIITAVSVAKVNKSQKHNEEQMKLRAKESKLSMDMMYACCLLSKGTAIALKNNHFNSEVDEGIKLVDKTTEAYNKFLRETAADSMNQ